jgi:hypothetical protein
MKMDYQMVDQGPGLAGAQEGGGENDTEKEKKKIEHLNSGKQQVFSVNKSSLKLTNLFAVSGNIGTCQKYIQSNSVITNMMGPKLLFVITGVRYNQEIK